MNRRHFLGAAVATGAAFAADMTQLNVLSQPALAAELKKQQKRCILLWLAGGSSQLETWDPKPGAPTGGPFRAIPTAVPGVHISELMPKMAARLKHTCILRGLMASEKLFDVALEPQKVRDTYGPTLFGEQCLATRRLIEAGVPFVRVGRAWWDSHGQNFETHQEMVPELDHVMSTLIDDLKDRGLLDDVMILTLAEFGRTPTINASLGRDHFASAWSSTVTGCGIKGGAVYGKSDPKGNTVVSEEVDAGSLFATIYSNLGINPHKNYYVGSRPIPLVEP